MTWRALHLLRDLGAVVSAYIDLAAATCMVGMLRVAEWILGRLVSEEP